MQNAGRQRLMAAKFSLKALTTKNQKTHEVMNDAVFTVQSSHQT